MPSFSPTITTNSTAVTVTSNIVSYDQIRESLGDYVYFIEEITFLSSSLNQIQSIFLYSHYDSNGDKTLESFKPAIDPFQYQNSFDYKISEYDMILDGQSTINFTLLPSVTLQLIFKCKRIAKRDALDIISPNNFQQLESADGRFQLFEDWQKEIFVEL